MEQHPLLGWFWEVEPPDPLVHDVVWGAQPRGEEYPDLLPVDGGGTVRQGGRGKAPVWVGALEVLLKGTRHVVRVCALNDFVDLP